ncbi:sugar ABC transporter substrate-binding protein [Streptosporangium violaceochromogenes]|nr:sugar ABC transporter substrate-binding protein [Streptosporangium violaceochromogenes]
MQSTTARALVGLLLTTTALTACSGTGGDSPELSLLLVDQASTKELQSTLIPRFEKSTGIKVNVELVPESGMDAKLALSLSNNSNQYDVVMTGAKNWSTLVASKWIKPLDEYVNDPKTAPKDYLGGFPGQLLETIKSGGHYYAMPYQVGADILFYNKKMFTAAGLDPSKPPKDMNELIETARRLTKADRSQAGFVGRGTREGNENSFTWIMMWFLNGGHWAEPGANAKYDVLTEKPALTTADQYKRLMSEYAPKGAAGYGFAEAQLAMQQGKAAMWLDAAQLGPALEDKNASKIAGDVGYSVLRGTGEDYIVGAVWAFSMTSTARDPKRAWELIKYLTGKDVAVSQAVSGTNGSPGRTDALADPAVGQKFNPEFVKALQEAIAHANPRYTPLIPEGTQIRSALSLALSKVLSGEAGTEAAMKEADDAIRKIMQ